MGRRSAGCSCPIAPVPAASPWRPHLSGRARRRGRRPLPPLPSARCPGLSEARARSRSAPARPAAAGACAPGLLEYDRQARRARTARRAWRPRRTPRRSRAAAAELVAATAYDVAGPPSPPASPPASPPPLPIVIVPGMTVLCADRAMGAPRAAAAHDRHARGARLLLGPRATSPPPRRATRASAAATSAPTAPSACGRRAMTRRCRTRSSRRSWRECAPRRRSRTASRSSATRRAAIPRARPRCGCARRRGATAGRRASW